MEQSVNVPFNKNESLFDVSSLRQLRLDGSQEFALLSFFKAASAHSDYSKLSSFRITKFSCAVLFTLIVFFVICFAVTVSLTSSRGYDSYYNSNPYYRLTAQGPAPRPFKIPESDVPVTASETDWLPVESKLVAAEQPPINGTSNGTNFTADNGTVNAIWHFQPYDRTYNSWSVLTAMSGVALLITFLVVCVRESSRRKAFVDLQKFETAELELFKISTGGTLTLTPSHIQRKCLGGTCMVGYEFMFVVSGPAIGTERRDFAVEINNGNYYAFEQQQLAVKDV